MQQRTKKPVWLNGREIGSIYFSDDGFYYAYTRNNEMWSGPWHTELEAAKDLEDAAKNGKL